MTAWKDCPNCKGHGRVKSWEFPKASIPCVVCDKLERLEKALREKADLLELANCRIRDLERETHVTNGDQTYDADGEYARMPLCPSGLPLPVQGEESGASMGTDEEEAAADEAMPADMGRTTCP